MTSRSRKVRADQNKPTTANPNCKCTRSPREVLSTTPGTLANTLLNTPTNYTSRNRPFFFKKSPNFSKRTCQPIETQLKPIEIISGWDTIEWTLHSICIIIDCGAYANQRPHWYRGAKGVRACGPHRRPQGGITLRNRRFCLESTIRRSRC